MIKFSHDTKNIHNNDINDEWNFIHNGMNRYKSKIYSFKFQFVNKETAIVERIIKKVAK